MVYLWQDYTSIIAGTAALLAGVPRIVLNSRNIAPDCGHLYFLDYFQPGYKVLLKQPNVTLINNSRAGADDYARWLKLPKDRIVILHNGFEPESITPTTEAESAAYRTTLNIPADASVVGSIFRLVPQKDPLLWVDTAALVAKARPDIHFLLIGGGYMLEPIRQLAEKAGIAERLHTPGTTTNPALPLSLFDLFLLTSRLEGIPNVLLEAQWLGIPAVSTDAGGARDALIDGKTGWIVDSRDPGEIARQVLFAMNNDEWYQAAKAAAPRHIAQHFGMERMVDETIGHLGLGGCPRID